MRRPRTRGAALGAALRVPGREAEAAHARGGWGHLTLVEQLAHIGSEVEHTIRAHEAEREERHEAALDDDWGEPERAAGFRALRRSAG